MDNVVNLNKSLAGHEQINKPAEPETPEISASPLIRKAGIVRAFRRIFRPAGKLLLHMVIRPYRRFRTPAILGALTRECYKLSCRDHFPIFVNYSAHVDDIAVTAYPGGWDSDRSNGVKILQGILPGFKYSKMRLKDLRLAIQVVRKLKSAHEALRVNKDTMRRYARN